MYWIIVVLTLLFIYQFIIKPLMFNYGVNMVQKIVKETTKVLKSWKNEKDSVYTKYLKDSNPEILWHKILAKYSGDKEELSKLIRSSAAPAI